jgi:hypothetical protein
MRSPTPIRGGARIARRIPGAPSGADTSIARAPTAAPVRPSRRCSASRATWQARTASSTIGERQPTRMQAVAEQQPRPVALGGRGAAGPRSTQCGALSGPAIGPSNEIRARSASRSLESRVRSPTARGAIEDWPHMSKDSPTLRLAARRAVTLASILRLSYVGGMIPVTQPLTYPSVSRLVSRLATPSYAHLLPLPFS